ncbi:hypothetical protein V8F33_013537 [Rhypophila sp. PSN 637]
MALERVLAIKPTVQPSEDSPSSSEITNPLTRGKGLILGKSLQEDLFLLPLSAVSYERVALTLREAVYGSRSVRVIVSILADLPRHKVRARTGKGILSILARLIWLGSLPTLVIPASISGSMNVLGQQPLKVSIQVLYYGQSALKSSYIFIKTTYVSLPVQPIQLVCKESYKLYKTHNHHTFTFYEVIWKEQKFQDGNVYAVQRKGKQHSFPVNFDFDFFLISGKPSLDLIPKQPQPFYKYYPMLMETRIRLMLDSATKLYANPVFIGYDLEAHSVKRLWANNTTYFVEAADEEVTRAGLPSSAAADVVLAASSNDIIIADDNLAAVLVSPKAPAGFFDLPLEIREMIYHQVLTAPKLHQLPQRNQAYRIGFPIGKLSNLLLAVAPIDRHKGIIKNEILPFVMPASAG